MRSILVAVGLSLLSCQNEARPPAPKKVIGPAQSAPTSAPSGALSEESARKILEQQADKVRACFHTEARWSLSVTLRVEPSGAVSQASVFDVMRGSSIAACAEDLLRAVRFPAFSGDAVRISYLFSLRASVEPIGALSVPVPAAKSQPSSMASAPADATAALLQAEKLFALGEIEEAEKALTPFVDKPSPEMLYLLGGIAAKKGQVSEMCAYYRGYLEVSPKSPAAPGLTKQIEKSCPVTP